MNAGKRDAEASFLPAYHYSPWKEGRTKEEQEALLLAEEMEIADGVEEIGIPSTAAGGSEASPLQIP